MHEFPYARAFVIVLLGYWIASKVFEERKIIPGAPTAGYKSMFEPTFWLQTRFITNANDILREGFQKVSTYSCWREKKADHTLSLLRGR